MQTVVTVVAVVLRIFFTEIMQQHLPSADGRLGVCGRLSQQLSADVLFGYRLALHELIQFLQVFLRIKRNTQTFAAISSGASRFLVIAFQGFGNVVVDDEAYIGFVDAHTKSNGGHNDVNLLHQEIILCL